MSVSSSSKIKIFNAAIAAVAIAVVGVGFSYLYEKKRRSRLAEIMNSVTKYPLHLKSSTIDSTKPHSHPPQERGVTLIFNNSKLISVFETVNLNSEIVNFVSSLQNSHTPLAEHIKKQFEENPHSIEIGWITTSSSKTLEREIINLYGKLPY